MASSHTVSLPPQTTVSVNCFTNAADEQRVTISQQNGVSRVLTGVGENNTPMPNGAFTISTPAGANYAVTVSVETLVNGAWTPSDVQFGEYGVSTYNLNIVLSEGGVDQDFNDAVVQFSWWTPGNG